MARTYFTNADLSDGRGIVVEYSFAPGSETTYSPAFGADGGDAPEVEIVKAWMADDETLVELADEDREKIEMLIIATHEYEPDDFYDPAEWRI